MRLANLIVSSFVMLSSFGFVLNGMVKENVPQVLVAFPILLGCVAWVLYAATDWLAEVGAKENERREKRR